METSAKRRITILLFGTFLIICSGCAKHPDDQAITKDVQAKILADPASSGSVLSVQSQNGVVTLKGTVKDATSQQKLDQIARSEPQVSGVTDQTAIVQLPPQPTPPAPEQAVNPAPVPAAPPPPPEPVILPTGTNITVTVDQDLNSKTSQTGQSFLGTVAQPVTVHGKTAIPKGSSVTGTVITAKEQGKIKGQGELTLALSAITVHKRTYAIETTTFDSTVKGKGARTAKTTGGGAAGGALIGGIAGGGKGAGIGALVGAGAGLVGGAATGNKQIDIPAESALTFALSKPLKLPPQQLQASERAN